MTDREEMNKTRITNAIQDISWIDEFLQKVKRYIYVRAIDRLLILVPNQAYRLNESGVSILDFLLKGHSVQELLDEIGDSETKRHEIHYFFCDLRAIVSGCVRDDEQRAALTYTQFTEEFHEYPVLSEVAVTYRCNLRCEFCYVGKTDLSELNTSDMKKILFKIYNEVRVPSVSFTGGEPLMRPDIVELVEYAAGTGLWTNLITNGTLINPALVEDLKRAGLASAQVSIEAGMASRHDQITGRKGSFDATVRGISALVEAGVPVHTNTTVTRHNIDQLEDIVMLAKRLKLTRLSMNLCIPCGSAADKQDIWVPYSEIGFHIMKTKKRADRENIRFLWYSPIPMCHFNPIAHGFGNKSCAAITGLLSIDPLGRIIPCSSWREPVGSLLKQRFLDIWNSSILNYFRHIEYAPKECRDCVNLDICKGACPLYWRVCGKKEISGRP